MKSDNSIDEETSNGTPSKKKLTQARLPFKIIGDSSPLPESSVSRKRKLSAQAIEENTKIGRLSKENEDLSATDLVVISDDDNPPKKDNSVNPLLKLVDKARKNKLQKKKPPKKKRGDKTDIKSLDTSAVTTSKSDNENDCVIVENSEENDLMDVDEEPSGEITCESKSHDLSPKLNDKEITENTLTNEHGNDSSLKSVLNEVGHLPKVEDDIKAIKSDISNVNEENQNITDDSITNQVTPKRSKRLSKTSIVNSDSKSDTTISPKLNESNLTLSTPKRETRSSSGTKHQETDKTDDSNINLTPKQIQRKLESAKKKEEREKEKQEKEQKRQQEKEERARLKQEKEDQKRKEREEKEEQRKKEKEEKEDQKKREKEEKEQQKEVERKMREEKEEQKRKEREEKEEQRKKEKEAKEEEKRKKQEALEIEKQEQELKKKKAAKAFVNFFVPKQKVEKDAPATGPISKNSMLSSFTIKVDMRLAPTIRSELNTDEKEKLLELMEAQNVTDKEMYLKCLKEGTVKPGTSSKTWPLDDKDDDVMIIEDELATLESVSQMVSCESVVREKLKPKLLSFHENRRPPYWGTWRKKSKFIKPRRPFGQDEKQLAYDGDSDEEWEEEEGESIDGSAAGSDDEAADGDEYEVDNEFFVPHGYLSDEEATMDEDDVLSLSPDAQKARLKYLEDEFESEMKKPTEKLKPRLYGLLWETVDGSKPEKCVDALWNYFGKLAMIMEDPTALLQSSKGPDEVEKKKARRKKSQVEGEKSSPKIDKKKKLNTENKDNKNHKVEPKKIQPESKTLKNQLGINNFLKKL